MNVQRITDQVGVVGIDATDYPDEQTEHVTTLNSEYLMQGLEILDTLGWKQVDVCTVKDESGMADHPMLVLRPPTESLFGGEQAGIAITPRTERGRGVDE